MRESPPAFSLLRVWFVVVMHTEAGRCFFLGACVTPRPSHTTTPHYTTQAFLQMYLDSGPPTTQQHQQQ